ncbi:HAD-IIIA family hydrolase [Candidatus Pacearchaeota archaeon]|nr:HAD-IIIA family hydrolase [Candidatus Pacearchaeota archaeon]
MENKAVFLDKDGVLVDNSAYPQIPEDNLLNVFNGLKYLQEKGYKLIIISNQPWISKKLRSIEQTEKIFKSIMNKLGEKGIFIDDYTYCPHQTSDKCGCKKPKIKLGLEMASKHRINLKHSFVIGDMEADINFGKNLGAKTILVKTGRGKDFLDIEADYIIENLNEINKII